MHNTLYSFYINLGRKITYYRKQAHMTQTELARQLSVSRSYISRIENPKIVQACSLELLHRISLVLEIPTEWLLEKNEDF